MTRQPSGQLEHEVVSNVVRLYGALRVDLAGFFQRWNLTTQQYNVLRVLAEHATEHGLPSQEIKNHLATRVPDVTRLLDRLEHANLVTRHRSRDCEATPPCRDRRVVRVLLTERGHDLVGRIRGPLARHHRTYFAHLDRQQLRVLNSLLIRAVQAGT